MFYFIKKLLSLLLFNLFPLKKRGNISYKKRINFNTKDQKLLLLINDNDFIHLGDSLFFEPIANYFSKHGYDVYISCINRMNYYFNSSNYKIISEYDLSEFNLIVTSNDFILKTLFVKNIIFINTNFYQSKSRIINYTLDSLNKIIGINYKYIDKPFYPIIDSSNEIYDKYGLNKNKKYIIYSNYFESGSFRVSLDKKEKLHTFLLNFKKKEIDKLNILHLGTKNDKLNDKKIYHNLIDFRGKTSVKDLFYICNLKNVIFYIGFDNFIMHLFFLLNKKCFIMSRGKLTKEGDIFLRNCIDPPYNSDKFNKVYI